jgi:hypothetical protein
VTGITFWPQSTVTVGEEKKNGPKVKTYFEMATIRANRFRENVSNIGAEFDGRENI